MFFKRALKHNPEDFISLQTHKFLYIFCCSFTVARGHEMMRAVQTKSFPLLESVEKCDCNYVTESPLIKMKILS